MKRFLLFFYSLFLILVTAQSISAKAVLSDQEEIAPGVTRYTYKVDGALAEVVKCDLSNPKIVVKTVAGAGKYTQKATVTQMANRKNAVTLVNGDFFTMQLQGAPLGASVIDSDIKSSPAVLTEIYSLGIDSTDTAYIERMNFLGHVTAPNGKSYNLDGINKTFYWYQPDLSYSHESRIQMYTDFWASKSRGDKTAGEVLLSKDNVVEEISFRKNLDKSIEPGKKILQVSGNSEKFIKDNVKIGDKLQISYKINPDRNWKMMIGGHSLLVDGNKALNYTKDIQSIGGVRARTAVGISNGGKTMYIVAVEARTKRSKGMSLKSLSNFLVELGVQRAINLDGGGSTAMSTRNLGDINRTRRINPEGNKGERAVVNGLGVFNITKNTNIIKDLKLYPEDQIAIGQVVKLEVKKAWDENLNPINLKDRNFSFAAQKDGINYVDGSYFYAKNPGEILVNISDGNINVQKKFNIKDENAYKSIDIVPSTNFVSPNENIKLDFSAILGKSKVKLFPGAFKVEFIDSQGTYNNGIVNISSLNNNPAIKVSLGSKSRVIPIFDKSWDRLLMSIGSKNYSINGNKMQMDTNAFIKENRTFVPLRFIAEGLGYEVIWNAQDSSVEIKKDTKDVKLYIGKKSMTINGQNRELDTAPFIKDGRSFVPIRFIAESMDLKVGYESSKKLVIVADPKKELSKPKNKVEEKPIDAKNNNEVQNKNLNQKNQSEIKNNNFNQLKNADNNTNKGINSNDNR